MQLLYHDAAKKTISFVDLNTRIVEVRQLGERNDAGIGQDCCKRIEKLYEHELCFHFSGKIISDPFVNQFDIRVEATPNCFHSASTTQNLVRPGKVEAKWKLKGIASTFVFTR